MNILDDIVRQKKAELATRKQKVKRSQLDATAPSERPAVSLAASLRGHPLFGVIAEVKRSSPSAGVLRTNLDPAAIAREYADHGAAAISVLTDECFFAGSLADLRAVRGAVPLPILLKDFVVDDYQVAEAKAHGADAVLLIAAILEKSQLAELHAAAREAGLEALVELYEARETEMVDFDRMRLIGINNRDLRTFRVDLAHSLDVARLLPEGVACVSESGITRPTDLRRLAEGGIRAALIGEHLIKSEHPGLALRALLAGM